MVDDIYILFRDLITYLRFDEKRRVPTQRSQKQLCDICFVCVCKY